MSKIYIVPGLGNSDEFHWQSWMQGLTGATRIIQREWDNPVCSDWIATIDAAVSGQDPSEVILVAHSLGCIAVSHWAQKFRRRIKGAMLVGPPDIENPFLPMDFSTFLPVPSYHLGFDSVLVASTNDHWVSLDKARDYASGWGSDLVIIGDAGHINSASGHGPWEQGLDILGFLDKSGSDKQRTKA